METGMDGSPARVQVSGSTKFNHPGHPLAPWIDITFQAGPLPEGVNGCSLEDVIDVLVARLEGFQRSPFACIENHVALNYLRNAKTKLLERTATRQSQGVEGTMQPHTSPG